MEEIMYNVVLEGWNSKWRTWKAYESKEHFDSKYSRSMGRIVAEGVTDKRAMELCGATDEMIKDFEDTGV